MVKCSKLILTLTTCARASNQRIHKFNEHITFLFDQIDTDRDGKVSAKELAFAQGITEEEARQMIAEQDANNDGVLDKDELVLKGIPSPSANPNRTELKIKVKKPKEPEIVSANMCLHGNNEKREVSVTLDASGIAIRKSGANVEHFFAFEDIYAIHVGSTALFSGRPPEECCLALLSAKGTILLQAQSTNQRDQFIEIIERRTNQKGENW